jgi:hypothetical protein
MEDLIFYDIECSNFEKFVCDVANNPVNFGLLLDGGFAYELGWSNVWHIPAGNQAAFESFCASLPGVSLKRLDLEKEYDKYYKKKFPISAETLDLDSESVVAEESIPFVWYFEDGTQLLTEGEIDSKGSVKICIPSGEQCQHSTPHVHIYYQSSKMFSVSLVNFSVLDGNTKKTKILSTGLELIKKNVQKERKWWNEKTNSKSHFIKDGSGQYTDTIEFID